MREWVVLLNVIRKRIVPTVAGRMDKARKVQALADVFIPRLLALTENSGCTYYMHAIKHHLADMIMQLPVDIMDGGSDSLENKNATNKVLGM